MLGLGLCWPPPLPGLLVATMGVWKLGCALSFLGGGGGGRLYTGDGRFDDGGGGRLGPFCGGGGGPDCLFSVDELQGNGRSVW